MTAISSLNNIARLYSASETNVVNNSSFETNTVTRSATQDTRSDKPLRSTDHYGPAVQLDLSISAQSAMAATTTSSTTSPSTSPDTTNSNVNTAASPTSTKSSGSPPPPTGGGGGGTSSEDESLAVALAKRIVAAEVGTANAGFFVDKKGNIDKAGVNKMMAEQEQKRAESKAVTS